MKSNRTNCNLKTCIKKRRVYFKDRFYTKKSRLLAFLLLIKTTFFILYEKFNDKTRLAFQNLCFCKKFLRFRVLNRSPDFKFVNSKRGAARRSPETTQTHPSELEADYKFVNHKRGAARRSPETTQTHPSEL